jgi:hypothetical protein
MRLWSAHDIEVLLHHANVVGDWPRGRTPAYCDTVNKLMNGGLIDRVDFPAVTEKGHAFIGMLLATPIPEARYIDPRFPTPSALIEEKEG